MLPKCRPFPAACLKARAADEAVTNIKEAIEGWLEVMETRHPTDSSKLVEIAV